MKLFYNLINSINGIKIAFKENSFILEILAGLFLVPYIIFIDISFSFKLIIIAVYLLNNSLIPHSSTLQKHHHFFDEPADTEGIDKIFLHFYLAGHGTN